MSKSTKPRKRRRRKDAIYYICALVSGEYVVSLDYLKHDPALKLVYGPWNYDKCIWWIRLLKNPEIDTSSLDKSIVWINPNPLLPPSPKEKKDETK